MADTHSRLSVGPLTMTLSIAGISESIPSPADVLHARTLTIPYESTLTFRMRLVSERGQPSQGVFYEKIAEKIVTVQIDNFDVLPSPSVKAAGKQLLIVSDTATKGILQAPKRTRLCHDCHDGDESTPQ
ncbi:unnamed protein product [Agarophyton chilense]